MKEAIEELSREQNRARAEKQMREKFGIPENTIEGPMSHASGLAIR